MLGNGTSRIRGSTVVTPAHTGRAAKKKKADQERLDRVDRDDERSALFDYAEADEEANEAPRQPEGHADVTTLSTEDAFRTDAKGRLTAPVYADVDQGNLSDAWLLASFAAVAHSDPASISDRFERYDDTNWLVTLAGEVIVVRAEFPAETYADPNPNTQKDTLWVALLEKAFALMEANSYESLETGNPGRALEILTDREAVRTSISDHVDLERLRSRLIEAKKNRRAMVVHTRCAAAAAPLHADHVYAVLDVFERDAQTFVKLYNPWGTNGGKKSLDSLVHDIRIDVLKRDADAVWAA